MIDWWIDWWVIDGLIAGLIDRLVGGLVDDWLIDGLIDYNGKYGIGGNRKNCVCGETTRASKHSFNIISSFVLSTFWHLLRSLSKGTHDWKTFCLSVCFLFCLFVYVFYIYYTLPFQLLTIFTAWGLLNCLKYLNLQLKIYLEVILLNEWRYVNVTALTCIPMKDWVSNIWKVIF